MRRNLPYSAIFVFLLAFLFLVACPMQQMGIQDKTPKEKLVWMMSIYNSQYADYMFTTGYTIDPETDKWVKTSDPELTENQRKVLREKKKILIEVHPLISLYESFIDRGLPPNEKTERKIIDLLNRLLE